MADNDRSPRSAPTADEAARAMAAEGWAFVPGTLTVEARDGKALVWLPNGRMAWFATSAAGRASLATERRVLGLIKARCSFAAPRVLKVSTAGGSAWEVRAPVVGVVDPTALYHRLRADEGLARRLGGQIGAALAQQHAIDEGSLRGWLSTTVGWPLARDWLAAALDEVLDDRSLRARIERGLDAYDAAVADVRRPVLTHGDLGLHNIVLEAGTDRLAGIFDYGGAALADRHQDFRYLLFDMDSEAMLEGAIAAYEPAAGVRLDRGRIRLFNAGCAIGFLAYRKGHAAEEPWCGRTLAEDLAWVDLALRKVGL